MPLELGTSAVKFVLGRIASRALEQSKEAELAKKLDETVSNWTRNQQPQIKAKVLERIFTPALGESHPQRSAARRHLSQIFQEKGMPTANEIRDALLEPWDEAQTDDDHEHMEPFFHVAREDAVAKLSELATELRAVLVQDLPRFQTAAMDRLDTIVKQVARMDGGQPQPTPADTHLFTVPYPRHNCFKGRDEILTELRRSLVEGKKAALTQVIRGLGGIGKTQTAVEYAYEHRDDYKAVLWIKAETELDITESMADSARRLGLAHDETKPNEAVAALRAWLDQNADWLLIFDNADHPERLKPFMPTASTGHILLTSRASAFAMLGILNPIELPLLSIEHAAEFLLERTGRQASDATEMRSARELADELGLLPLALEQAGAYIHELKLSFAAYLERYRKRKLETLQRGKPALGDYPESVATTWAVNFDEVESKSPPSADLLQISAFLAPDNIPFELVVTGAPASEGPLAAAISESEDPDLTCHETLQPLTRFSLISVDSRNNTYSIHRLVQEAVKHTMDVPTRRACAGRAVRIVNKALPNIEFENWNLCRRLVPQAAAAANHAETLAVQTIAASLLANQAGVFFQSQAQFKEAEPLYKQALEIKRTTLGEQHASFATSLNNLAELYRVTGRHDEAEPLYKQALEIDRIALGEQHPDFAMDLNNLALLYNSTGRYNEAEPLYKQALEIDRIALGEQHPGFGRDLNNLAGIYRATGRHDEAEPLFKQALEIHRTALGEQHPHFATSLNNLAETYRVTDRHDEAEPLYKQALEVTRTALGEHHPSFATRLNNLAAHYQETGRHDEAEPLYKQALEIRRDALGEQHPDFAQSLNNLASLYESTGRYDDAEPLYKQALEIWRTALGEQHPSFAIAVRNLAGLYRDMGRNEEAEALEKRYPAPRP